VLVSGATVDDIDFALPTAGAISGRVLDEMGEPITGAEVHLLRYRTTDGVKMLTLVARAANPTDDLGQFRIGGVPQGEYYLCAEPFGFGPLMPSEFARLARTYYPGTPAIDSAQKISIGIGEEMSGLVLPVVRVRPATLSGVVIDSDGTPTRDVTVSFQQASFGNQFGTSSKARDGRFELNGEPPGDYFLQASVDSSSGRQQASAEVTLAGIDTSVTLRLGTAVRIGGRITLESGPRDESLRTSRLWAVGAGSPDGVKSPMAPYLPVRDDWTFDGWAVPGWRSLLRFTAPEGWTTSRITGGGRDLTDEPVEFVEDLIDLEVVLTNRVTTVSGFVRDARGNLLRDAAVIVFADDPRKWRPFTRYVRAGVLDQTGRFTIRGLPAGRYLAVALDHLEEGAEGDPELLARLRGRGTPITLGDAEARTMELRVVDPIR
jgi:hypothetical protein